MKKLKELTLGLTLIFVFAVTTIAGEIDVPGPKPPPSATASGDIHIPGEIHVPGPQPPPSASVADVAMNVLQVLLLVF